MAIIDALISDPLFIISFCAASIYAVGGATALILWRQDQRERFLLFWALSWFIHASRWAIHYAAEVQLVPRGPEAAVIAIQLLFMMLGAYDLLPNKPWRFSRFLSFWVVVNTTYAIVATFFGGVIFLGYCLAISTVVAIIWCLISCYRATRLSGYAVAAAAYGGQVLVTIIGLLILGDGYGNIILNPLLAMIVITSFLAVAVQRSRGGLADSQQKLNAIFDSTPDAIGVTRKSDGLFIEVNRSTERLIGYPREKMLGRSTLDLGIWLVPQDRADAVALLEEEGVVENFPTKFVRGDGRVIDVSISVASYESGGEMCIVWSWADVTNLRNLEREMADLNISLERRVQEQTAELTATNRALEAFGYSVAHDLQSPLTSIGGFVGLLRKSLPAPASENTLHFIGRVEDGVKRMSEMIGALLRFSKLGNTQLVYSEVDMKLLTDSVVSDLEPSQRARTKFVIADLPSIRGDANLLRQVWQNLIGNAVKYSGFASVPEVRVGADIVANGIEYWVADNGDGFDMAHADKIFEVFTRLHQPTKFAGVGVGLAISHNIVKRHGGTIRGTGEPGKGARFCFQLPV